jgi:hypothetical protein
MTEMKYLTIILLLATWLCLPANAQSVSILQIKENFVSVDRLRARYVESGRGPAVVMIHGNAASIEDFEFGVIQTLSSNYRVIAVDRPGPGKSDRPTATSASVEYQARLLHQVLSSLRVHEPVLVGRLIEGSIINPLKVQRPYRINVVTFCYQRS